MYAHIVTLQVTNTDIENPSAKDVKKRPRPLQGGQLNKKQKTKQTKGDINHGNVFSFPTDTISTN